MNDQERFFVWAGYTAIYGGCLWWLWNHTEQTFAKMKKNYDELLRECHELQQQHIDLQTRYITLLLEGARDDAVTILSEAEEHED